MELPSDYRNILLSLLTLVLLFVSCFFSFSDILTRHVAIVWNCELENQDALIKRLSDEVVADHFHTLTSMDSLRSSVDVKE